VGAIGAYRRVVDRRFKLFTFSCLEVLVWDYLYKGQYISLVLI